jgi:predicted ribosomally synthesized peptide with nif11-like leader
MSVENAKALLAKVSRSKDLTERLNTAGNEGFEQIAEDEGHPCTINNIFEVLQSLDELSEEELDQAVGGVSSDYYVQVAKHNGLNKFRHLSGGSTLVFPPITQ